MNKFEKIFAPKMLTVIQTVICFALIVVLFVLSFGNILTLKVSDDPEFIREVNKFIEENDIEAEIPETIDISVPFFVKTFSSVGAIFSSVIEVGKDLANDVNDFKDSTKDLNDSMNSMNNGEITNPDDLLAAEDSAKRANESADNISKSGDKLKEKLASGDGIQGLINLACLFMAIVFAFKSSILVGFCYLAIIFTAFLLPITCTIKLIISLVAVIKNRDNLGAAFHKVSKSYNSIMNSFPIILFILLFIADAKAGGALIGMFVTMAVGIVLNLIISRLKVYDKPDFKFINIFQIFSAASLASYLLFFFNFGKIDLVSLFFKTPKIFNSGTSVLKTVIDNYKELIFPLILIIVFVMVLLVVASSLVGIVTRLSCTSSNKSASNIVGSAMGVALVIIPVILTKTKLGLVFSEEEKTAFILYSVGLILMLALEIGYRVVVNALCKDVPTERRAQIVTGAYIHELAADSEINESTEAHSEEDTIASENDETPHADEPAEEEPSEDNTTEEVASEENSTEEPAEEETQAKS